MDLSADGNTAIIGGPGDSPSSLLCAWSGVDLHAQRWCLDTTGSKACWQRRNWSLSARHFSRHLRRRKHRYRRWRGRQRGHWGGLGLHTQRRRVDAAGPQAGRHRGCGAAGGARQFGCSFRRRQHCHRRRVWRQRRDRRGLGFHALWRCLDPTGPEVGRYRCGGPSATGHFSRPFRRRQYGSRWRGTGQGGLGCSLGVHAQRRRVDAAGAKLVGTGTAGLSQQGWRVSLSADGNTAISGGFDDAYGIGAAWIFSRNAGAWTQQGPKLVASYASNTWQGWSVALSGDGNTAMIGGPGDGSATGAAWIFTRGNSVWTQYGPKLVGTGGMGTSAQGSAVALSTDGDTAIVGASGDSDRIGATWVFTRVQQSPSVSPIPTAGVIGLLALSAMLAIVGLRALRQPWASD